MDEDEFRATYHAVNTRRCIFEKAINSRVCNCSQSHRFNLADREGVSCTSESAKKLCADYLYEVRSRARFVLRINNIEDSLPHGSEIKLQNGGLLGLQSNLIERKKNEQTVDDIAALLDKAGRVEELQYQEIVDTVAKYQGRRQISRNRCK